MSIEGQGHFLIFAQGLVHTKIQTGFSQKLLCRSELILFMKTSRYKEMKIFRHDSCHMTKMAATPIYGKNPSKKFSGTCGLISMKLGMQHQELQPIIVCSNDDPRVTLTYFTARQVLLACVSGGFPGVLPVCPTYRFARLYE